MWESLAKLFSIGSSAIRAGASIYQAREARKASKRQAEMERANASRQAEQRRHDMRRRLGVQRASFAAQGLSLDGSPGVLLEETERFGEEDIRDILNMGNLRAKEARRRGKAAWIGGGLGAVGSLLDGGFDYYRTFEQ